MEAGRTESAANALRLNVQVWVSDERFVLRGRNDATTIARAAAAVRGVVGELLAPYEAFSASSVRATKAKGRVSGLYDIKLVGENRLVVDAGIARLAGIGFYKLAREDELQEDDCFTLVVPKVMCIGPLLADLANLTGVSAVAYETGGGILGAGDDKARVVVKGSLEAALGRVPACIRWEEGRGKVLPPRTGAGIQGFASAGVWGGDRVMAAMPRGSTVRARTLKMGVLAIGVERADINVGRPLRQFFAEMFMAAEGDVSFFSLHRKGFTEGAFEVTIPDTVENRELKAALVDRCVTGAWKPSSGNEFMHYHDPTPPSLIITVDGFKLIAATRLLAPDYIDVGERVEASRGEVMDRLRVQLGAFMETAAADRAALLAVQAHLRSELMAQSTLQTQALKDQLDQTKETITALQVQTTGIVEGMRQHRCSVGKDRPGKEAGMDAGTGPQQDMVYESDYEAAAGGSEWNAEREEAGEEETHAGDEVVLGRLVVEDAKAGKPTTDTQDTKSRRVHGQGSARRRGGPCTCDVTGGEAGWWRRWGTFLLVWLLLCVGGSAGVTWAYQKGREKGAIQGSGGARHNESPMMLRFAKYRSSHGLSGLGRAFAGGRSLTRKKRGHLLAWPVLVDVNLWAETWKWKAEKEISSGWIERGQPERRMQVEFGGGSWTGRGANWGARSTMEQLWRSRRGWRWWAELLWSREGRRLRDRQKRRTRWLWGERCRNGRPTIWEEAWLRARATGRRRWRSDGDADGAALVYSTWAGIRGFAVRGTARPICQTRRRGGGWGLTKWILWGVLLAQICGAHGVETTWVTTAGDEVNSVGRAMMSVWLARAAVAAAYVQRFLRRRWHGGWLAQERRESSA